MTRRDQITSLLLDRAARLADLLADTLLRAELESRCEMRAEHIDAVLSSDDEHEIAETVADLFALEHGDHEPTPEWWQTPLGRATAKSIGTEDADVVTPSVAAAMLGISPTSGRVRQLVASGKLVAVPGGITRASVMARLAES